MSTPLNEWEKASVAVALSWGAGVVDIVGYLSLHHAFVAHMTGNAVSSVLEAMDGNGAELFHRAIPIATFFIGLVAGEVVLETAKRRDYRHVASWALGLEAICLAAFLVAWLLRALAGRGFREPSAATFVLLVGLIAIAMGVQSASLRKVGALTIFTTFLTGTLTQLATDLADYLFWLRDRTRGRLRRRLGPALRLSPRQQSFRAVLLLASLFTAYALGALTGTAGFHRLGVIIVAAPLVLVVGAIAIDLIRPISPMP